MTVSYSSGYVSLSGSTEGAPDTLSAIVAAVNNTSLCRMDAGRNFWIGNGVIEIDISSGWLRIQDGESFQMDNVKLRRDNSAGGITFQPKSRWIMSGNTSSQDDGLNTFRTGFTCVCERDTITGAVPLWIMDMGTGTRHDGFSCYGSDRPLMKISGLTLWGRSGMSVKFNTASGGYFRFFTMIKDSAVSGGVPFEFQAYCYNDGPVQFDDPTFVGFTTFASHDGYTGQKIIFNRPRYHSSSNFTFDYLAQWGNGQAGNEWQIIDPVFLSTGVWNGSIQNNGGPNWTVRVMRSDQKKVLAGASGLVGVNLRWVSSDPTNSPAIEATTDSNGDVPLQLLTTDLALPANLSGGAFTPSPTTWSCYARKYGRDTQPEWALYENVDIAAPIDTDHQATVTDGIVDSQATADAYTGITLTDHGGSPASWQSKSWRYTITGDLTVNPSLTASQIWHYFESALSKQSVIAGVPGLEIHDLLNRNTTDFTSVMRAGRGCRVVDQTGAAFPGFSSMQANDGTFYAAPTLNTGTVTFTNPNTRIVVYNEDTDTVIHDAKVASSPLTFSYVEGTDYTTGDTIRVYHIWYNAVDGSTATKKDRVSTVAGASGWSVNLEQEACATYAAYYTTYATTGAAVDSSGDFVRDIGGLHIDLDDSDNTWYAHRLFMWDKYDLWNNSGRRAVFMEMAASDPGNLSIGSLSLDNINTATAYQGDTINVVNAAGTLPVVNPTTGGGGITMYSGGKVLTTSTGGIAPSEAQIKSWVRAELATEMARIDAAVSSRASAADQTAIKAKTDALVINSGKVDANVESMNGAEVIGTGTTGDAWRGVGVAP